LGPQKTYGPNIRKKQSTNTNKTRKNIY